ncbi:uncharacterized protein LOC6566545 [Drosophila grimshawi]|uniref:GH13235 n=1 Tax=Drosophila grimshawi TaxID=7222 RepID=B4JQ99_DROGR|nr:uncharacterized protein LOC6566545 [Drosophila grimshawi]EDV99079.1 GH13235 [Drosophila grimshawi]
MNPVCLTDINKPECQTWMKEVCARCRKLLNRHAGEFTLFDETPAVYKDVLDMTFNDCSKLKHLLQLEVAAIHKREILSNFTWWQKLLLILVYIGIVVLFVLVFRYCRKAYQAGAQQFDEESAKPPTPPTEKAQPPRQKSEKRKKSLKSWLHYRCRPIFVHNEAALRRQQAKYKEVEANREEHTQKNIDKWTKAREKVERKRQFQRDTIKMMEQQKKQERR